MTTRFKPLACFLRWHDRRHHASPSIPALGWQIFLINQQYRSNHYWQLNRGNG